MKHTKKNPDYMRQRPDSDEHKADHIEMINFIPQKNLILVIAYDWISFFNTKDFSLDFEIKSDMTDIDSYSISSDGVYVTICCHICCHVVSTEEKKMVFHKCFEEPIDSVQFLPSNDIWVTRAVEEPRFSSVYDINLKKIQRKMKNIFESNFFISRWIIFCRSHA